LRPSLSLKISIINSFNQLKNRAGTKPARLYAESITTFHSVFTTFGKKATISPLCRTRGILAVTPAPQLFNKTHQNSTPKQLALSCESQANALTELRNKSMVYRKQHGRMPSMRAFSAGHVIVTIHRPVCQAFFSLGMFFSSFFFHI